MVEPRGRVELREAIPHENNYVAFHFVLLPNQIEIVQNVYASPPDPEAEQVLRQAWKQLIALLDDWRMDARDQYTDDPWDDFENQAEFR